MLIQGQSQIKFYINSSPNIRDISNIDNLENGQHSNS